MLSDSKRAEYLVSLIYATEEESFARRHNSSIPYFRLEDSLCKNFLKLATNPREFEGLKLLFPFIREMSLLRFGRTKAKLADWMCLAFAAGHDLGRAHPEFLEEVLPGVEMREAWRRISVLQKCSGQEQLTSGGLDRALACIVESQWAEVPENQMESVLIEAAIKSLRTGFAAATVSQGDPKQCDFVWDIPTRIGNGINDIANRAVIGAPLNSVGKPVGELLEHPLLRLQRELYPKQPIQCETVLAFVREQLGALQVSSENECPVSELDLMDWISAGIEFGDRVKVQRPHVVEQIFCECGQQRLEDSLGVVREVVADSRGLNPLQLLARLKHWQEGVYGWVEPQWYGDELARVAYFSDFAIWIPWATPKVNKRGD